jgi:hypothetical protein
MSIILASDISWLASNQWNQGELDRVAALGNQLWTALAKDAWNGGIAVKYIIGILNSARGMTEEDHAFIRGVKIKLNKQINATDGERKVLTMAALTAISDIYGHWCYAHGQRVHQAEIVQEQTQIKELFRVNLGKEN